LTYAPADDGSTSDHSSDKSINSDDDPDPTASQPDEIAGVANNGAPNTGVPERTTGVHNDTPGVDEAPGVDEEDGPIEANEANEFPGVDEKNEPTEANDKDNEHTEANNDNAQPKLEVYVTELEAELDEEIDAIDSNPNDDGSSDDESHDGEGHNAPLPRLRPNRTPNYRHLKGRDGDGSLPTIARPEEFRGGRHQSHIILQNIVMTQYNLRQGIKKFGDQGKAAVLTELRQLYDRYVMNPVNKYDLTPEERKGALRYLMFLKEKRSGTIKGQGCADGRPQRDYMSKKETSSPTVATEALLLTCTVDAVKGRDVATCDIPGAHMQSDMKGKVVMKLEGVMAKAILKIDPKQYSRHTVKENGKDVIYAILKKAL
jgi:hypothetical protein